MVPPRTLTALPADFGKKIAGRADPYPTRSRCRRTPPRRNQNHHENHAHQQRRNQPADAHPEWRLTARTIVRSRSGFGSGDDLDELGPGPALAGLADTATRPGRIADLDDDELIGALRAWRRLESWSAAGTLSVVAELARRRPADGTAPAAPGRFPDQPSEFLTDEIAAALTLTGPAAGTCLDLAMDLATRLPGTAAALRAGIIDYLRARIIAEATRILSAGDARRVEALILAKAGQQTSGQLRAELARTILAIDPGAAAAAPGASPAGSAGPAVAGRRRHRRPGRVRAAARRRAGSRPAPHRTGR